MAEPFPASRAGDGDHGPAPTESSTGPTPRPLALVTGGARRVGRAISLALAAAGCDLIVTFRDSQREARSLAGEARPLGATVAAERLDLADLGAVRAFAHALARSHTRLDVLVHNASVYGPSPLAGLARDPASGSVSDAGDPGETGDAGNKGTPQPARTPVEVMTTNALAPLVLTAGLADLLRASILPGGGAVVAMCDIHSMGRPRKDHALYSMSKAALEEMVRSLARDMAPQVRVNGVAPGVVAWPEDGPESDAAMQARYLARVPLERAGTPKDAAEAVRWLALDAHYTTGQIIRVDGGRWLA